ncbi:immunoglobulin A1 protease autotransporter-like [Schistocerca gregaria]|uniref:immunoglobulin A1 protease autotransporter-like n=1 Tax=Schistocerca gregaria TaxID=7010 RepID=UPI00211E0336|nr:immunoglobulin A1 protease autotransporter-like [Schistocerca gregaria]
MEVENAASDAAGPVRAAPLTAENLTPEQVYKFMKRLMSPHDYPGRAADERAERRMQMHLVSIGCVAREDVRVPPGAPPGVSIEDDTVLPGAAPMGDAPPVAVIEETAALLVAPPVSSEQEATTATDTVPPGVMKEVVTVLPVDAGTHREEDIVEANLGDLLEAMDTSHPSRKRPAATEEDDPSTSSQSFHRGSLKKKMADDPAPTEADQATEDGFVVPKRRHTARAKRLETVQPLPTTNSFVDADEAEDMEATEPPKRRAPAPPPITVSWKETYKSFLNKFESVATAAKVRGCSAFRRRPRQQGRAAPARKVQPGTSYVSATKGEAASANKERQVAFPTPPHKDSTESTPAIVAPAPPADQADTQADHHKERRQTARPPTTPMPQLAGRVAWRTDAVATPRPAAPAHAPAPMAAPSPPSGTEAADLGALLSSLSALLQQLPVLVTAVGSGGFFDVVAQVKVFIELDTKVFGLGG